MRKTVCVAAGVAAAALALAGCGSSGGSGGNNTSPAAPPAGNSTPAPAPANTAGASTPSTGGTVDGGGAKVGIILPDTISSPRWVSADPDALAADCKKYNLDCQIQNAQGSTAKMKSIANQMESGGIKFLVIVNLSPSSGAAIEQQAKKAGITPIDYDRLTPGGGAALYVSFDGVAVGKAQGQALTQCPQVANQKSVQYVEIDGASTDNNALLFEKGYESVLSKKAGWTKVGEQDGQWNATTAGREFNSMLNSNPKLKAVMVANDTMAGAVISDLKRQNLNGKVAVSGQDATAGGLQQIMDGNQCFTIYKPSNEEADPAMKAIAEFASGKAPATNATVTDPNTHKKVPSILAKPIVITKKNVAQPINDGYTPKKSVCTGKYVAECKANGVK